MGQNFCSQKHLFRPARWWNQLLFKVENNKLFIKWGDICKSRCLLFGIVCTYEAFWLSSWRASAPERSVHHVGVVWLYIPEQMYALSILVSGFQTRNAAGRKRNTFRRILNKADERNYIALTLIPQELIFFRTQYSWVYLGLYVYLKLKPRRSVTLPTVKRRHLITTRCSL